MKYEDAYYRKIYGFFLDESFYEKGAQIERKRKLGDLSVSGKVFEFGCGLGQNIYLFEDRVGFSHTDYASEFCKRKGIPVVNSLDELPSESFDWILLSHVLEHTPQPFETLLAMKRLLKPEGRLLVFLPKEKTGTPSGKPGPDHWDHHLFAWTFQTFYNLLDDAGFETLNGKEIGFTAGNKKLFPLFERFPDLFLILGRLIFLGVALIRRRPLVEMRILARKRGGTKSD